MYKLLIADDEDWIRERLRYTIEWKDIGVEVIGEASDGEEALEISKNLSPDIIITDIRMPGINGLEFIEKLRTEDDIAKIIIISGYSDFDYAHKALKYGASDYIIKPVEDEEIICAVKRCIEDINVKCKKDLLLKKASEQIEENYQLYKEKFLINLLNGYFKFEEEVITEIDYLQMNIKGTKNICFIIELDEMHALKVDKQLDENLLQFVTNNIIKDFIKEIGVLETISMQLGEVICFVFTEKDQSIMEHITSLLEEIRRTIKEITDYSVTIGLGMECNNFIGISISYMEAKEALQYKSYLGKDRIYDIRGVDIKLRPISYLSDDIERLLNNIKVGNKDGAVESLEDMFKGYYVGDNDIRPIDLKLIYINIVNPILKIMLEANSSIEEFSDFSFKFLKQLDKLQTINEICICLKEEVIKIIDIVDKNKSKKKRKIIEIALEYINNSYNEQITLNSISNKFFINASYFCKIFKQETGQSFTKYLINLRIQKAKELLLDPTLKVYEVAEKVGYDDVQYFSKTFKNFQGVTPLQYREKVE